MKLKTVEKAVMHSLESNADARQSDFKLYIEVLKFFDVDTRVLERFFEQNKYSIPSFESVTRCRRQVQKEFPELKDKRVSWFRKEVKEPEFKAYSKSKPDKVGE